MIYTAYLDQTDGAKVLLQLFLGGVLGDARNENGVLLFLHCECREEIELVKFFSWTILRLISRLI